MTGKVKWYSGTKGYGFIENEGRNDIFFHRSGIDPSMTKALEAGDEVEFTIGQSEKGQVALGVKRKNEKG